MLKAMCASCYKEKSIVDCVAWRGWELDRGSAFGLCEDCKNIFNLYDGQKTIEDMIRESEGE